ncbi:hypothetical protein ACTJJ0_03470 [Chitinophaga sp. 22321]|uniref:ATPase AAA-type core domain-containing protein n=1 Tax=Chitinophaga hostae TaxID=2831022 RepID=A0ABS5IZV2_9BACT|nr:hypothetical protein [Chitinophaga hostae]MBS0027702.1 hypothetical protein [Chitinophaga hostae]
MEIHYIWIKSYNSIKESGINVSSRYIIEMQPDLPKDHPFDHSQYKMIIKKNNDYLPFLFEQENIVNVNAIIGKNGAGKSSILGYMCDHFSEGFLDTLSEDVLVYSVLESENEVFYVLHPHTMKLNKVNETNETFKFIPYQKPLSGPVKEHLKQNNYIYYSYLLDYNSNLQALENTGFYNLSTTFFLSSQRRRNMEEFRELGITKIDFDSNSDLDHLITSEVAKAIDLIASMKDHGLDYLPSSVDVGILEDDQLYLQSKKNISPGLSQVQGVLNKLRQNLSKATNEFYVFEELAIAIFANFCRQVLDAHPNIAPFRENKAIHKIDSLSPVQFLKAFFKELSENDEASKLLPKQYRDYAGVIESFFDKLKQMILPKTGSTFSKVRQKSFSIPIVDTTMNDFRELMGYILQLKGQTPFVSFFWRSLSGGEQSYLSFMARFFSVAKDLKWGYYKDLVILIDEGDIGYHPAWQRKFLKTTIDFLSTLFKDNRLQIIFTANSPFISSDLPKSNIVFLNKEEGEPLEILGKNNDRELTFGANIHTLFSDSFYMEGILIGDFAKDKLQGLLKDLNEENYNRKFNKKEKDQHLKLIDQIGEPILRRKMEMIWQTQNADDGELEILTRRIEEIKRKKLKKSKS